LVPTQFAGGQEAQVVKTWGLFDRILDPAHCVRLALGFGVLPVAPQAVVVHLGGDLWISARLAKHLHVPVCVLTETTAIAHRHRAFSQIFSTSESLAARLVSEGVPPEKIVVSGDPRADVFAEVANTRPPAVPRTEASKNGHYTLTMLPGSRDRFFRYLAPFFADIAGELASIYPEVTFQIVTSPFLSHHLVKRAQQDVARSWPHLHIEWVGDPLPIALAGTDLALTIPGTNTLELALAGIPFAVVLPTLRIEAIPAEGLLEWIARIPGIGRFVKTVAFHRYFAKPRFVALPNIRAGRALVPEWVGRWTPSELANRLADLLRNPEQRAAMTTALQRELDATTGASMIVATRACALANTSGRMSQ
jgi:lipid-A-disaccharide synthase